MKKIYDSDDLLVTDAYLSLLHFSFGEEAISKQEWLYFIRCFEGHCKYNMEEKIKISAQNLQCLPACKIHNPA